MDIQVLASSSAGNAYIVREGDHALLLECGIRWADIQRGMGFETSSLAGCLVTHEHGDHASAVKHVLRAGVDVYASRGTWDALGIEHHRAIPISSREQVQVGPWAVLPFTAIHDAAEPLAFVVGSPSGDKLLYITDSAYSRYRVPGLTHILVECNYSMEILRQNVADGTIPLEHKNRVIQTHMGLERVVDMLDANDLRRVREIHLLHLSDTNSDEAAFKHAVQRATGKPVYVAGR